jgi:hypothetical protein
VNDVQMVLERWVDESRGDSELETVERIGDERKLRIEELYAAHAQGAVRLLTC